MNMIKGDDIPLLVPLESPSKGGELLLGGDGDTGTRRAHQSTQVSCCLLA